MLHAGDYDIACLKRDFGFSFANLFDTMLAAQTLGETNLGLAALLETFELKLEKNSNGPMGPAPLPHEMLVYAQNDSITSAPARALQPRLEASGMFTTFIEDCATLADTPPAQNGHEPQIQQVRGAQAPSPTSWVCCANCS